MSKTIEITLDEHCTQAIENAMTSGIYTDHNAVIHEALALLEKKQAEERLTQELQKGIDSGFDHDFDYPEWLRELNQNATG